MRRPALPALSSRNHGNVTFAALPVAPRLSDSHTELRLRLRPVSPARLDWPFLGHTCASTPFGRSGVLVRLIQRTGPLAHHCTPSTVYARPRTQPIARGPPANNDHLAVDVPSSTALAKSFPFSTVMAHSPPSNALVQGTQTLLQLGPRANSWAGLIDRPALTFDVRETSGSGTVWWPITDHHQLKSRKSLIILSTGPPSRLAMPRVFRSMIRCAASSPSLSPMQLAHRLFLPRLVHDGISVSSAFALTLCLDQPLAVQGVEGPNMESHLPKGIGEFTPLSGRQDPPHFKPSRGGEMARTGLHDVSTPRVSNGASRDSRSERLERTLKPVRRRGLRTHQTIQATLGRDHDSGSPPGHFNATATSARAGADSMVGQDGRGALGTHGWTLRDAIPPPLNRGRSGCNPLIRRTKRLAALRLGGSRPRGLERSLR
ncbi:hypothetical protein CDD83_2808 [Cordyceps sp. RAO-2017]|nr:hypothetical protein CDD83_2808 [Cordyceps sp. RAO-2017]